MIVCQENAVKFVKCQVVTAVKIEIKIYLECGIQ